MDNWKNFCRMVDELFKTNSTYQNEIKIFKSYLQENNLKENIFNLELRNIDDYFNYCFENQKIGSSSALTTHFSALRMLFKHLESNNINFKGLHGYINLDTTKECLKERFDESLRTSIINDELLKKILYAFDSYIDKNISKQFKGVNDKKRFLNTLVARIYIKLSLIIPLKPSEVLNLGIYNVKDKDNRYIEVNKIIVKIPNSIRTQILQAIDYIEENTDIIYNPKEMLFKFLYEAIGRKYMASSFTSILNMAYDEVGLDEMKDRKEGLVRDRNIYTSESYKTTAILGMLKNGTDILALKQLTGLDFSALMKNYDLDIKINDSDIKSTEINTGICKCDYFTYL